jgi:hypothetical protein
MRRSPAPILILGKRCGPDGDVRAAVEELDGCSSVAAGPVERNAEEADGRPTAVAPEIFREAERRLRGSQRIVGLERGEIAHEVDIAAALNVDQRPDERVVGMEAARQDQR